MSQGQSRAPEYVGARVAGRNARSTQALILLGVVVVVLGLVVGGLWWSEQRIRQAETAGEAALRAAPAQVVALLTEQADPGRTSVPGQTGDPVVSRQQVTTRVTVIASGVVRADPDQVLLLLFVNQSTQKSRSAAVELSTRRIQLTMRLVDGQWRVSKLEQI